MKKMVVDGNEACARSAYLFTEVAGIYPITPSSPMAESVDEWSNQGKENIFDDKVNVVEMQSEAGAAGMIHGSLQAGCLTTTFTASQGLLLMIPNMYKIAGEMLPGVIHVAARSLSTHALSIFGDHQDVYATRATGFAMLASSSVQDAAYLGALAHLSAIKSSIPFLHFFDGFRTSHELQKVNVLEKEDVIHLVDQDALKKFRERAINPNKPYTIGTAQNDDIYFQATEVRNGFYDKIPDIVADYMNKINEQVGSHYKPFEYYGNVNAKNIIVAMGSVCETIKEFLKQYPEYGLIEVHLYRPFSIKYLLDILPESVQNVAVLDRTKEAGSAGEPLYLDVVNALKEKDIKVVGGRYGLSSKNTTPGQIKAVYTMLEKNPISNFTIGIEDDVTHLSLKEEVVTNNNSDEFLVYGYGSDGMVSASKSLMKLVGNNTEKYVQAYFQYDSKKSGGVTVGHLRFSDEPIRAAYYVEHPKLVVVTKDTYFNKFHLLDTIKEKGILIVNTIQNEEEWKKSLSDSVKSIILEKNLKVYIINAYEVASKLGIKNKISTILESVILYITNIMDYEKAKEEMKKYASIAYEKKGSEVVLANHRAIEEAVNHLKKIEFEKKEYKVLKEEIPNSVFDAIEKRMGDSLPTSAFLKNPNGVFESNTTRFEKRCISNFVPHWVSENCIMCNQCSFVCPHAVIRPYLLSKEEYDKAPEQVKKICLTPFEPALKDYYFALGISIKDCTGCGLCIKTCPGKKGEKALVSKELIEEINQGKQEIYDYLEANVKEKDLLPTKTVKGSQFQKPKFMFHGACAGCGEATYLKLLTQLFGDQLIISNATGCSSIYGASAPSIPYNVPWASSLFEDNAEYGYGMLVANETIRYRLYQLLEKNKEKDSETIQKWLDNFNSPKVTKEVYETIKYDMLPKEVNDLKEYLLARSIWTIGGDGWAYDIGFGGIDHVLSSNQNVNILVLDTQVYSNTGGQSSKATPKGSVCKFASHGKKTNRKDLARIALSYPNCYVAQVSLGGNMQQVIKAMTEAQAHQGPSLIIAYSPCISHGIEGGLVNSVDMEQLAVTSGYFPIFRYNPDENKFTLDSKQVNFDLYEEFLMKQNRFSLLKKVNPEKAKVLLEESKEYAKKTYEFYQNLEIEK